ncbi:MAG TPA: hypothetical protein VFY20_09070 [Gemmatimonadales bacterium]|nr:hypothetical protein [Gemmatimonadales bacterium]
MNAHRWMLLLLLFLAAACDDDEPVACTEEFRTATVFVADANAEPVTDATVRTYHVRTGELVPVTSIIDLVSGYYVILDDNATRLIPSGVEQFRVTASRGEGAATEAFYGFSAPQGCHIEKVSGPDTLVVP